MSKVTEVINEIEDPSMSAVLKIVNNPKVDAMRNTNSPRLSWIEIERDKDGKALKLITHYELRDTVETVDERSSIMRSTSPLWVPLSVEEVVLLEQEKARKYNRELPERFKAIAEKLAKLAVKE